jgi:sugar lactone lactonase YvrE
VRVLTSHASRLIVGGLAVAVVLAACGSSASAGVASQAPAAPTNVASTNAAAVPTPMPTPAPSATPAPNVTPAPGIAALPLLWQKSGPAKATTETYWPAIDPVTGNVWVASSFDNQFWIFKPDGTYLESWGTPGKGDGQFHLTTHDVNPDGGGAIAFAPDGSFYVADVGNFRVEKFDKGRNFVTAWGSFGTGHGQFTSPKGIATDGKTVFVADDGNGTQAFDAGGHFLRAFDFPFVLFSLGAKGDLVVAEQSGVLVTDVTGKKVGGFDVDFGSLGGDPSQAVVDKAGNTYVGLQLDSGPVGLVEFDRAGKQIGRWLTGAETMALAPDGSAIYMAYTGASLSGWPYIRKYALPKP